MFGSYLPVLRAGLLDSLNPGALTGLFIFLVFLFFAAKARQPLAFCGSVFIIGVIAALTVIDIGFADWVLRTAVYDLFLDGAYILTVGFSFLLSLVCLRDWMMFRTEKNPSVLWIRYPFLDAVGPAKPAARRYLWILITALISGVSCAFVAAAWPADVYLIYLTSQLCEPGRLGWVLTSFGVYGLVFVWPLSAALWIVLWVQGSPRHRADLARSLPKVQVITAAVSAAYGVSLLPYLI